MQKTDNLQCPHCRVYFSANSETYDIGSDPGGQWWLVKDRCKNPECSRNVVWLYCSEGKRRSPGPAGINFIPTGEVKGFLVYPKGTNRPPVPVDVPDDFSEDYREACLVLADSPKASAALSRRCLQYILEEKAGATKRQLNEQIDEVLASGTLPTAINQSLHALREIGNLAAHANKYINTGEIVAVEPGEAEWGLDVIELLFDHYFVGPADLAKRKDALNNKLTAAGRNPLTT